MVERKETKQAQRTRKLIQDSFVKLLSTRGYSDISVLDICDDALISRGTFYAYFEDKSDLLNFCTHEIIMGFDKEATKLLPNKEYHAYYNELFEVVIKYLTDNKQKIKTIFTNSENGAVMSLVEQYFENNFRHRVRDRRALGYDINMDEDVLVTFFSGGCMNIIKTILTKIDSYNVEDIAKDFNTLVVETLDRVVIKV